MCVGTSNTTWLQRSPFLAEDFSIKTCDMNLSLIRKCAEYRLGQDMLERTKMNTNTQKVEASNRSMRRSLTKYVTFSRNFPGWSHSAAHNINHGPGESLYKLCKAVGSPIFIGTRVSRALYQQQKNNECHKRRKNHKTIRKPGAQSGALCTSCMKFIRKKLSTVKICYFQLCLKNSAATTLIQQ